MLDDEGKFGNILANLYSEDHMSDIQNPTADKKVYRILHRSGLVDESKCPSCGYAPILETFNYCPMCTIKLGS